MGTPCVTTRIGSEGMYAGAAWGGAVCASEDDFVLKAVQLYISAAAFADAQTHGLRLLQQHFSRDTNAASLCEAIR